MITKFFRFVKYEYQHTVWAWQRYYKELKYNWKDFI